MLRFFNDIQPMALRHAGFERSIILIPKNFKPSLFGFTQLGVSNKLKQIEIALTGSILATTLDNEVVQCEGALPSFNDIEQLERFLNAYAINIKQTGPKDYKLETRIKLNGGCGNAMLVAIANDDVDTVRRLLQPSSGYLIKGQPYLVLASYKGNTEIMECLINAGSSLEGKYRIVTSELGRVLITPLAAASLAGNLAAVDFLLSKRVSTEPPKDVLYSPLRCAARGGYRDIVNRLLGAGANIDAENPHSGYTALMTAAQFGRTEIVRDLLLAGAGTSKRSRRAPFSPDEVLIDKNALGIALHMGHAEIAQLIQNPPRAIIRSQPMTSSLEIDPAVKDEVIREISIQAIRYAEIELTGEQKIHFKNAFVNAMKASEFIGELCALSVNKRELAIDNLAKTLSAEIPRLLRDDDEDEQQLGIKKAAKLGWAKYKNEVNDLHTASASNNTSQGQSDEGSKEDSTAGERVAKAGAKEAGKSAGREVGKAFVQALGF